MLKDARTTPAWLRQKRPAPATKDCPHWFSNIALKATPCPLQGWREFANRHRPAVGIRAGNS